MKKKIYLDHAATTPVDPAVLDAMQPYFTDIFGNPGSLHSFGQAASGAVFIARQMIAKELNCHYSEVIFTGSATEANNLALRGAVEKFQSQIPRTVRPNSTRIVVSAVEHESILQTARDLERDGVEVVIIPVSKEGIVDIKKLKAAFNERTALVSAMFANNEVGSIQPIAEIAKLVRDFRATSHALRATRWPLLHTDAVQAFQYIECDVQKLGVDLLTLSAHKIYGPKGVGCLYVRNVRMGGGLQSNSSNSRTVEPILAGGGQENGLRSGTENVPYIVGFSKAVGLAAMDREDETVRVAKLRDMAWKGVRKIFPKAVLNGPSTQQLNRIVEWTRLPNNLNFFVPGVSGEQLLVALDLHGVAVSSGSACVARSVDPSHVLLAMGHSKDRAKNSIRLSLGRTTTRKDISGFLNILKKVKGAL